MLLGVTSEDSCVCYLCDWKTTSKFPEEKLIEHLRYSHCRILLTKQERKNSVQYLGPKYNQKAFLEGK